MTNNQEPQPSPIIGDPMAHAWKIVAAQAAKWIETHPNTPAVLLYREATNGLDLTNRKLYLEIRGDLIHRGDPPFGKRKILAKFYATIEIVKTGPAEPSRILTR